MVFAEHDDCIFAGTVAGSLRLANPAITPQQAVSLLRMACLDEARITADTAVGSAGRALSGGERRRLALARVAAATPAVLLLDEPTEGLDPATARHIMTNLRAWLPATTLIVAMHDRHAALMPPGFGPRVSLDQPRSRHGLDPAAPG